MIPIALNDCARVMIGNKPAYASAVGLYMTVPYGFYTLDLDGVCLEKQALDFVEGFIGPVTVSAGSSKYRLNACRAVQISESATSKGMALTSNISFHGKWLSHPSWKENIMELVGHFDSEDRRESASRGGTLTVLIVAFVLAAAGYLLL